MQVVSVVGARPQFIKAAVVSRVIAQSEGIEERLVHTGQHYDTAMSSRFFDELDIPTPTHNLQVGSGPHGRQTALMLRGLEEVFVDLKPDVVLVYGDTNSTLAATLAAVKLHIPVAHVEAGLRSFNMTMPEEINRVLTDRVSRWLLTPTDVATRNLIKEGVPEAHIRQVGDVMLDAALYYAPRADDALLDTLSLTPGQFVLATIHRAENTDDAARLRTIFEALMKLATIHPVVLPLHPRTRHALKRADLFEAASQTLRLLDPVGYLQMVALLKQARLVATDSGGVQKEAFFHQTPCVTLRDETEWVELIDAGWNRLAPPGLPDKVFSTLSDALLGREDSSTPPPLYGDGQAGRRIVDILRSS